MKNLLIVDDDKNFLVSLGEGLSSHNEEFNVFKAYNGEEAVQILKTTDIDLVVSDLKMPKMDGFELLAYISKNHKNLSVIIITAFGTPEIEKRLYKIGSFQYLEKPLDFDFLADKIENTLNVKSSGYVRGISLPSFIQLINMEKKSCTLKIQNGDISGRLYFNNGDLIDAETGILTAKAAAYNIVCWENPEIEIIGKCNRKEVKISTPINIIMLEALTQKDELNHIDEGRLSEEDEIIFSLENETYEKQNLIIDDSLIKASHPEKTIKPKEGKVNIKKLNEAVNQLKDDMGEGLLATDIWMVADGQTIAGYNSQPKATALFNRMTDQINKTLEGAGFPGLGRYYIMDLADRKMVIILPMGDFRWGMLVDAENVKLGLLLNISIPRSIEVFNEAIKE